MQDASRTGVNAKLPDAMPADPDRTLGSHVSARLRERLIGGAFQPGDKLSLRSLAQEFGVSVQPVRHAVSGLIGDEALEVAPNRAVRVPIMTAAKFDELTAIRLAIEVLDHASKPFATRRMTRALEQGFRGRDVDAVDEKLSPLKKVGGKK